MKQKSSFGLLYKHNLNAKQQVPRFHKQKRLIEQAESASLLLGSLLLWWWGGLASSSSRGSCSLGGSRSLEGSKGVGVGQELLDLLSLLEVVTSADGNGNAVLEGMDDGVRGTSESGLLGLDTNSGNCGDGIGKEGADLGRGDVENSSTVHGTIVVDGEDSETVVEGENVQLLEKNSLRGTDLLSNLQTTTHNIFFCIKGKTKGFSMK